MLLLLLTIVTKFTTITYNSASVLWRCWFGGRKGIWLVKNEWWGAGMFIRLERDADLHMSQLMPLPLTVSCFSKIQMVLPFWYRLTRVVPDKGSLNVCVCTTTVKVFAPSFLILFAWHHKDISHVKILLWQLQRISGNWQQPKIKPWSGKALCASTDMQCKHAHLKKLSNSATVKK